MDHLQFCYWLQGYFEIGKPHSLNKDQVEEIKNHLDLVFKKVTPVIDKFAFVPIIPENQKLFTGRPGISARPLC